MDILLMGSRLILTIVFAVAGIAKLADRQGTRQAIIGLGVTLYHQYENGRNPL